VQPLKEVNGWIHTGDAGFMDTKGKLSITRYEVLNAAELKRLSHKIEMVYYRVGEEPRMFIKYELLHGFLFQILSS
jgi:hypothetical protein